VQAIQFTADQSVLNDAKMQQMNVTNVCNAVEVFTVKGTGIPTPTSLTSSPVQSPITPVKPSTNDSALLAIKQEPVTPSLRFSLSPPPTTSVEQGLTLLSLDEQVQKVADADPEFAAAFQRQKERELEEAKLICLLDNKEACLMCSG